MFNAGPHQLYAAIIRPALTNKGCMYVCMYAKPILFGAEYLCLAKSTLSTFSMPVYFGKPFVTRFPSSHFPQFHRKKKRDSRKAKTMFDIYDLLLFSIKLILRIVLIVINGFQIILKSLEFL